MLNDTTETLGELMEFNNQQPQECFKQSETRRKKD